MSDKLKSQNLKVKSEGSEPSARSSSSSSPQTMEELLNQTGYQLKGLKKGDQLEGKITRVSAKEVLIDIGGKSEGVVMDRELEFYKDMLLALNIGDTVTAQVIVPENDRGQSVLSVRKFITEKRWKTLEEYQRSGQLLEVILREPVRGGILVDYSGIRGYIPMSQLDQQLSKQLDRVSGRRVSVKVVEVDKESNRLVFSQRAAQEAEAFLKQKPFLDLLEVGKTVEATITTLVPFGAFAKFIVPPSSLGKLGTTEGHSEKDGKPEEVEGLIHISEIAWEKVDDASQYIREGDTLKVKIVSLEKETGKVTLSIKQLLPDPWEHVLDMFENDSEVKGTVSKVTPIGIFVTLSPGVEGLIHISKVAPGEEPKAGEEITCIVEDVQPEKRKISLSMALTEKPIGYR